MGILNTPPDVSIEDSERYNNLVDTLTFYKEHPNLAEPNISYLRVMGDHDPLIRKYPGLHYEWRQFTESTLRRIARSN